VKKMTYSQSIALLGPEFDDFLFAPLGDEKNGLVLRVVSALARLDMDPWDETANLAALPRLAATERLTGFIAALPDTQEMHIVPRDLAAGLIARLPPQPAADTRAGLHPGGMAFSAPIQAHPFFYLALVLMLFLANLELAGGQRSAAATTAAGATLQGIAHPQPVRSPEQP
jgi:hypothetical protein